MLQLSGLGHMARECPRDIMCHTCGWEGHRMGDPECRGSVMPTFLNLIQSPHPKTRHVVRHWMTQMWHLMQLSAPPGSSFQPLPGMGSFPQGPFPQGRLLPPLLPWARSAVHPALWSPLVVGGETSRQDAACSIEQQPRWDQQWGRGKWGRRDSGGEGTDNRGQWLEIPCSIFPTLSIYLTRIVYGHSFLNTESTMTLKIITINTSGIVNNRRSLFYFLKKEKFDIICLQETHVTNNNVDLWKKQWYGPLYFSEGTAHSKGQLILLRKNPIITRHEIIFQDSRILGVKVCCNDKSMCVFNVYGPNIDNEKGSFSVISTV